MHFMETFDKKSLMPWVIIALLSVILIPMLFATDEEITPSESLTPSISEEAQPVEPIQSDIDGFGNATVDEYGNPVRPGTAVGNHARETADQVTDLTKNAWENGGKQKAEEAKQFGKDFWSAYKTPTE